MNRYFLFALLAVLAMSSVIAAALLCKARTG